MHSLIHTPSFKADAKAVGVTDAEKDEVDAVIAADPKCGDLVKNTGGVRKVRIATENGGKSGGYRVFFYYAADDVPIFLLRVIGKTQRANLSKAERNQLQKALPALADAYRASVKAKAEAMRAEAASQ